MLFRKVIRRIKTEYQKNHWIYSATEAALYLAIGGFIEEANKLLNEIWKHRLPYDRTTWLPDNAFEILWHASGKRPENVPFEKMNIDKLEIAHRDYLANPIIYQQYVGLDFETLDPSIKGFAFSVLKDGKFPDKESELKGLKFILSYLESESSQRNYHINQSYALASELAARNGITDVAIDLTKKWANSISKENSQINVALIGSNRHLSNLLVRGVIAEELGLNKEIANSFVNDAVVTIQNRINNGPSLIFGELNWTELLKKLSILSLEKEPTLFNDGQKEIHWIGIKPANIDDIKKKEIQLDLTLPEEYKSFLLSSNGLPIFSIIQPRLSQIEEIGSLKELYFKVYGDYEIFEIVKTYPGQDGEDFDILVESAICISDPGEESEVWLIPPHTDITDWECWEFSASNPGEHRYKNFRFYIENKIQFFEDYY